MDQSVPNTILISVLMCHLSSISEKPLHVHIHSVADTVLVSWRIANCIIYFGFSNLRFSPLWEMGPRISHPTSITSSRAMDAWWDRGFDAFKLHGVKFYELHKHKDEG